MRLIEVELDDLKKVEKELADLLRQRLKTDVTIKGGKLFLDQTGGHVSPKDAKLQVKHAVRHLGLVEGYRVLSEHHVLMLHRLMDEQEVRFSALPRK